MLLVRARKRRHWQLPGGGLKRDETPREALRREVDEETGLVAVALLLTGRYLRSDGSVADIFRARVAPGAEPAGPRNEIRSQRWVEHADALRMLPRRVRQRLVDALAARA